MKVSKSLLQAVALGLTMSAVTSSCNLLQDSANVHFESCTDGCDIDHALRQLGGDHNDFDCPACGMG